MLKIERFKVYEFFAAVSLLCFFSFSLTLFFLSDKQMPLVPAKLQGCENVFVPQKNGLLYEYKNCFFVDEKGEEYKVNYSTELFNKMILEPVGKEFMVEEHFFTGWRVFMICGVFISLFIFMMTIEDSMEKGSNGIDNNRRDNSGGSDHPHSYSPHDNGDSGDSGDGGDGGD